MAIAPEPERDGRAARPGLVRLATAPTDIVAGLPPVAFFSKTNALVTDTAPGGIICGRILQPLEMGLVRTKVETHGLTPVAL